MENLIDSDGFLDRNPIDAELDIFMLQVQKIIKDELSLNNIYLGYNLITQTIFDDPGMAFMGAASVGKIATLGFSKDELEKYMMQKGELYLCYIALPIDDDDYLTENDMLDWEFEKFLKSQFRTKFVSVGAISINKFKRCRTFKFLYQKQ